MLFRSNTTLTEHATLKHTPKRETPALPPINRVSNKPPAILHHNNTFILPTEPTLPPFTRHSKLYPILSHQERKKRITTARRRGTAREKLHHATNQHPLADYWPDITPQSLPIALHPPTPEHTQTTQNLHSLGLKTALPVKLHPSPHSPHPTTQQYPQR